MENHVICIPFPAQGHIRPMLKLAQLLHFIFGFHITFINTHHIHQTLFKNHIINHNDDVLSENKKPLFRFESFPEGLDDSKDIASLVSSIISNKLELPLKELLIKSQMGVSVNTCMISDVTMCSFTLRVAQELGIPAVVLETGSACAFLAYFHFRQLIDKGIIPLPDKSCLTNGYLEKAIDFIPSLKGICLKDMPTWVRTTDPNDMMLNIAISNQQRALSGSLAIIINTFDVLDEDILKELSTISPDIYAIGPLNVLVDYHLTRDDTIHIGPSILCENDQQDYEYMQWLDSQEPKSVLYISFGTIVGVTQETLLELAWGLANSHVKFLWVVRSDLVIGECDDHEFEQFEKEIKGRGVLASWCDQERVLGHPSIGGFFTHCGWNSTIESISYGVPMICWPFTADQVTNSWYCCNCLGIGVKMRKVKRDEVERMVKEFMEMENSKEMRTKAMNWKKLAKEASMTAYGTSYVNLKNLVNNVFKIQQ